MTEQWHGEDDGGVAEALAQALAAMLHALVVLLLFALTLLARALQAVFVLARPGILVGSVAAAGYTSVTLFRSILALYGNDLPAALLALATVVLAPATLLILVEGYDGWAIMLAVAAVDLLALLGLERAPPTVLALLPVAALVGCVIYFLRDSDLD